MKKEKLITISILPGMWLLYFLFEFFTGRINTTFSLITNLSLVIFFALIGYILFKLEEKYFSGFKNITLIKIFTVFMLLEQGSKIIIKFFFFDNYFEIIPDFLSFHPIINVQGSWLNARFGLEVGFPLLILTNIIAVYLFFAVYRYIIYKGHKSFNIDMAFLFLFTGALCSLIDKVFYGGSLDFIGISNLFIADIKDCYINLGLLFFILALYKSGYLTAEEDTTFKDDLNNLKAFFKFCIRDFLTLFTKKQTK